MDWDRIRADLRQRLRQFNLSSLGSKILLWSFLPTALILAAVAGTTFISYLQAAEDLAISQNEDLARYAGGQLAADLTEYSDMLEQASRLSELGSLDWNQWDQALAEQSNRLVVFRGGVVALDQDGTVVASEPERPDLRALDLSDRSYFRELMRSSGPIFSDALNDGINAATVVAVASPVLGADGSARGVIVGFFQIGETSVSAFYGDVIKLRPGGDGHSYLVDGNGTVLFHSDPAHILERRQNYDVVRQALAGETGARRIVNESGVNVLASFAPVPGTDWGLIIEQSWFSVVAPVRSREVLLAALFLLGVLVPGVIVTRGVRRITKPVVDLVDSATRIAQGEYDSPDLPQVEGELGELATQFTKVAAQLRAAQEDLERRVEARTRELSVLLEAIQGASSSLELDQVLQEIAESLAQAARVSHCVIFLPEEDSDQLLPAGSWVESGGLRRGNGLFSNPLDPREDRLTAQVLRSAQPAVTTDPDSAVIRRSKLSSILEVPLVSKGQVLAVAVLGTTEPDHLFAKEEVDLAFGIATTAAAAIENAELYMQLQARVREIEGLYQADEELHRYLDLEAVLQSLVDVSVDIMGANKSSILAWDEESGILKFQAGRGFKPETIEKMNFTPGEGVIGQVVIDQEPLIVEDTNLADHVSQEITKPEGIRAFIHIPVVIGGTFFGVFNVNFLAPRQFRQEEIRSFTALAQRAALAIENASLYGQSKELAVYEERQRLARDLHDAVTQTLFSASLMAEVLPKIWDRDQAEGIRRLEELRKLNRGALAEMRTLLLELRPTALVEAELDELLQQLSEAISSRAGVEVDLKVEGSCPMPASAKIAIYRLAQEAFNNIAKHAQASHVEVHLNCSPEDGLALRIKDDGKGFDPERIKMGHLGLGIMKERAEEIGGQFNINSEAGGGTEVTFEWQPEPAEEKYYEREYN